MAQSTSGQKGSDDSQIGTRALAKEQKSWNNTLSLRALAESTLPLPSLQHPFDLLSTTATTSSRYDLPFHFSS